MECAFFIVITYLSNYTLIYCSFFPGARNGGGTQLSISGFTSSASVQSRTPSNRVLGGQQSISTGFQNQKSNPFSYVNNSKLTTAIADWIHAEGMPFRVSESKRFLKILNVARTVGDDYKPPGRNVVSNELLEINFDRTMTTNKERLIGQRKFGYTGMGDGATVGGMPLSNELWMAGDCPPTPMAVHDCTGHMAAGGRKDAEFIANQFIPMAEELDPDNAHGIIDVFFFDGASNVQKAGLILNAKYPTSHTLHGIEHVFSLFFDDMANLKPIKVCLASSSIFISFLLYITSHVSPYFFLKAPNSKNSSSV